MYHPNFVLRLLSTLILANQDMILDHTWPNHQRCAGIYGQPDFSHSSPSSIFVEFPDLDPSTPSGLVSVVIFGFRDEHLGGITVQHGNGKKGVGPLLSPFHILLLTCWDKERNALYKKEYREEHLPRKGTRNVHHYAHCSPESRQSTHYACDQYLASGITHLPAAFSGQPFEAKMHIVDGPGRGILPSYMKSALTYSRTLAFVAVFLVSLYGIWAVGKQERNSRPRWIFGMNALVAASTGVAVLRWIDLELQNEDFGTLVLFPSMLVTNLLRTFQIMLVISYVSRSCQGEQDSGSWKSKASKWFWIPLGLLTSILTTRTISSAYTSVGLGLVLITAGVCAILGLQRLAKSQPGFEKRNENRSRTVLQFSTKRRKKLL
ncbi:uncharacterized protein K444DRAFT_713452 [Hyaloscypha bicolor E]|uniref:Transmembrane protein n=1 Tax=Hyaloscypha bicolor E TaxID=1095630 RepID=A0A2J6SEE3_9HELO|nr:uncharacterized protein K444DRAFT_713452 [Hyaloscypha bicolor E]PMD49122.1 hypothetical protein K444DRAFT_713452 [Hyaloscypha bicolor E]